MNTRDRYRNALEDGLRVLHGWRDTINRLDACKPGLAAASYDTDRSSSLWCEMHERDLPECRKDDLDCDGIPAPSGSDRTGNAAVSSPVFADERAWHHHANQVAHHVEQLYRLTVKYADADPTPDRDSKLEAANRPKCEIHLRYGHDRDARSTTTVKRDGTPVLSRPYALCEWCADTTKVLGRLPTDVEVDDNVKGKRLRVTA